MAYGAFDGFGSVGADGARPGCYPFFRRTALWALALVQLTALGLGATPSAADVHLGLLALAGISASDLKWRRI